MKVRHRMRSILFVDDEANILRAIKRLFRNLEYECYYASCVAEVVDILVNNDPIDMLVSDIKMPNFDGIRLLKLFKEASPSTIRVALTGYASAQSITEAISKNLAKQYFFKPWDNKEFLDNIQKMFILEDKFIQMGLFNVIQDFDRVKTIPKLYENINNLVQRDASIEDVCRVIQQDMAMTSNVLRIANSAFYAAKTGDLQQAVMYIGLNNLKQLILSYEIAMMNDNDYDRAQKLWQHGVITNLIYQDLYERYFNRKIPPGIGSAGLLHDIGSIIMLQIYGHVYYDKIIKEKLSEEEFISEEERNFNINHAIIGGYFLNWWAFPMDMVEIGLYHHNPKDPNIMHAKECALMCLASHMAKDETKHLRSGIKDSLEILDESFTFLDSTYNKFYNEIQRWQNE